MARTIKVIVHPGADAAPQTLVITTGKEVQVKAVKGARYEVQDLDNKNLGPQRVSVKRVGNHLQVSFDDATQPDLLVEDYYTVNTPNDAGSSFYGKAEDGSWYQYVSGLDPH